ncbi:class I SAM-dependent methyltransferase [Thermodesulfobacteriota bacterium]
MRKKYFSRQVIKMKSCPYCNAPGEFHFNIYARSYYRCSQCDLLYQDVERSYEEVLAPYRNGYYSTNVIDQIEGGRDSLYEHILNIIEKRKGVGTILDIGAGCGFFIVKAQEKGWVVKGIEPSVQSIGVACRDKRLDIFKGSLQEYPEKDQFDVITFINVLDHSAAPWQEIKHAGQLLKPGGLIYIRFPNGLLHACLYRWAHKFGFEKYIVKFLVFHEFSFLPEFIKRLLSDSNFSGIAIFNSPPSKGDPHSLFLTHKFAQYVKRTVLFIAKIVQTISFEKILLGTSLEVIAFKDSSGNKY